MSEPSAASPAPFDLDRLQQLIELMEKHGLSEVSLRRGQEQWRLRRGSPAPVMMSAAPMAPMPAAPPPPMASASAPPAAPSAPKDDGLLVIKAPTVGTFYSAQTPEDPPFVSVGSKVSPQTTVCLIEAMKVFNPIPAEVAGTIAEVLVKNGDAVEYGQALFKVRP
uniref:Biotin carboxyl carrier protein of acetyl-CoA carboxylase n=1 Tax=Schlesneria paludicola TaxID=360056 RepID=A0A7C2P503_9PLAN